MKGRRVAQVGGRMVELAVYGHGTPSIVLESGLGDDLSTWEAVFDPLAERRRAFAYSRAGFGESSAVAAPRDLVNEAGELRALLCGLGEPPPYVLVGHSWGGLIVQAYAAAHPQEVAGIVLVDSAHPDLMERLDRDTPDDARAFDALAGTYSGAARLELDALAVPGGGHFPGESTRFAGPVIILGAWMFAFNESERFRDTHRLRIEEIAAGYPQAELRKIACGHYIQRERPLAVIDAIDEVLARVGAQSEEDNSHV